MPTKVNTRPGECPDDLSYGWYMHYLIGKVFTSAHAIELIKRINYQYNP